LAESGRSDFCYNNHTSRGGVGALKRMKKLLFVTSCLLGVALIVIANIYNWDSISRGLDFLMMIAGAFLIGWGWREIDDK